MVLVRVPYIYLSYLSYPPHSPYRSQSLLLKERAENSFSSHGQAQKRKVIYYAVDNLFLKTGTLFTYEYPIL